MYYVQKNGISNSWRALAVTVILLICSSRVYPFAITADEPGVVSLGSTVMRNQSWLSSDGMFAMGIFSLKAGANYLGIWYAKISSPLRRRIIWVANRDTPASNSVSVQFRLDGNLVLLDQGKEIWSSNTSRLNVSFAQFDDKTGNFALISRHNSSSNGAVTVWESFDTPCDTLLPGMKIRLGLKLTAWKDSDDPAHGRYSIIVGKDNALTIYWNSTVSYWTSGGFDGNTYSNMPFLQRVNKRYNQINLIFISGEPVVVWNTTELYERIVLSHKGYMGLQQYILTDNINTWQQLWFAPDDPCNVVEACGAYGVCTPRENKVMECSCATGFHVSDSKSWNVEDTSEGCVRSLPLNCSSNGGGTDKYYRWGDVAVYNGGSPPLYAIGGKSEEWCSTKCLSDCSCIAYSHQKNGSCFIYSDASSFGLRNSSSAASSMAIDIHIRISAQQSLVAVAPSLAPAPAAAISHENKNHTFVKILLFFVLPILALASGFLSWMWWRKWRSVLMAGLPSYDLVGESPQRFTYNELRIVTKNFSHKVGSGGFGDVYKGFFSEDRIVAVKKLKKSKQREKEFQTEVLTIGAIHHQNLVKLLGFCAEGNHRLLVYEYLENSSLDRFLFNGEKKKTLSWGRRFSIAVGTARGLAYIHEECRDRIMHFDVKPANILLDRDFAAKLSDFGTAKLVDRDMSRVITRTRGTRGYMAPEWLSRLPITTKADVYSYGVSLLEIVSGRKNVDLDTTSEKWFLPVWASSQLSKEDLGGLADIEMEDEVEKEEMERAVKVALWCIQEDPQLRPSMATVVQVLQGDITLPNPPIPSAFTNSGGQTSSSDV